MPLTKPHKMVEPDDATIPLSESGMQQFLYHAHGHRRLVLSCPMLRIPASGDLELTSVDDLEEYSQAVRVHSWLRP